MLLRGAVLKDHFSMHFAWQKNSFRIATSKHVR